MADKFDEIAWDVIAGTVSDALDFNSDGTITVGGLAKRKIAQALRDVANDCMKLALNTVLVPKTGTDQSGCGPSNRKQREAIAEAIKKYFGLED